nr:hypothetical protein [uncultured Brevundimonas sp.]
MAWIAGLVVVIGFTWLMVTNERFRRFGFGLIVVAAIGIAWLWAAGEKSNREFRAEMERERTAIPVSAVELRDLSLSDGSGYVGLTGTVVNHGSYPIQQLTVQISLRDCPNSQSVEGCTIIGQDDALVFVDVPPGQARAINTTADLSNAAPRGPHWGWTYGLKEVRAKLD